MKKSDWQKLLVSEGFRLALIAVLFFVFWKFFRKHGDNAKAAASTAAAVAGGIPTL